MPPATVNTTQMTKAMRKKIRGVKKPETETATKGFERRAIYVFAAPCCIFISAVAWCAQAVQIPGAGQGYQITKNDSSQPAPSGYEGRSDSSTETAVGNTSATSGKRVVAKFTLENRIKTCPLADGTAEGTGVFSMTVDYTDAQANSTGTTHIEMRAEAKYKGQVRDDAYLTEANAEIDYTYDQSGSIRQNGGGITTPAGSHVAQHVTIPIMVAKDMTAPTFGAFSGGDPAQAHYGDAFGAGTALAYWAGIYYSIAQVRWRQGECAQIVFNPPSNTRQPPLGTQTTVNAELRAKSGETAAAQFVNGHAFSGALNPTASQSDVGKPAKFAYTAPEKNVPHAGFEVGGVSRAGIAQGEWKTGLGTGWSGEIYYQQQYTGDEGNFPDQQWSNRSLTTVTVTVVNGVASWHGHVEKKSSGRNWQPVFHAAHRLDTSDDSEESGDGTLPAAVQVFINEAAGTYSIQAGPSIGRDGKSSWMVNGNLVKIGERRWTQCNRTSGCKSGSQDMTGLPSLPALSPLSGKFKDPNHIEASVSNRKEQLGRMHNAVMVESLTVNLSRSGSK